MRIFWPEDAYAGTWKRQLQGLFEEEAATLEAPPVLTFTWKLSPVVGEINWDRTRGTWARLNLRAFSGSGFPTPGGRRFFANYACLCLIWHLRILEGKAQAPRTYLEGLAQLEGGLRQAAGRRISLYRLLPAGPRGIRFCYTPIDLFCASSALEDTQKQWGNLLSAGEAETLARRAEELAALAALPEIGYYGGTLPESSLIRTFRQAGALMVRYPDLAGEAGFLKTLSANPETLCTPEHLLARGEANRDPFCLGSALRLLALTGRLTEALMAGNTGLQSTAAAYRRDCVQLAKLCRKSGSAPLADTLAAAEKIAAPLNRSWERAGGTVYMETIRPMGDVWRACVYPFCEDRTKEREL